MTHDQSNVTGNHKLSQPEKVYLTYAQKYEQMNRLRQTAWDLKYAAVRMAHADWTDEQIIARVREIFLYATT